MSDDVAAMIADIVAEVARMYPEVSDPATAHNHCKIIGDALHERLLAAGHPSELVWVTGLRDDRQAVKPVVPEHVIVLVGGRRYVDGSLVGGILADLTSRQHDDRLEPTALFSFADIAERWTSYYADGEQRERSLRLSEMGARASTLYALETMAKHYGLTAILHDIPPDGIERQRPAVDFIAHGADGLTVAIEHTLHEPYDGYTADTKLMYQRLEPVRQRLRPLIADDVVLDLSIKPGSSRRLRTDAIGDLSEWAVRALPSLGTPPNHGAEWIQPPKGPYVRLRKWPRDYPGPSIRFRLDVDVAQIFIARDRRTATALRSKLPKLDSARVDLGATTTVLVMQSNDWQMTDTYALGEAIRGPMTSALPLPDFVFVVATDYDDVPLFTSTYRAHGEWIVPYAHHDSTA